VDVLELLDRLDGLVQNARGVPLTDQVRIDREEISGLLDQVRATIPGEMRRARYEQDDRAAALAKSKRQCDRLLSALRDLRLGDPADTLLASLAEEVDALAGGESR
jgi:hypothetical protein